MSGMQSITTGVDRYKLTYLAKEEGIELTAYGLLIDMFEEEILKQQKKELDKANK